MSMFRAQITGCNISENVADFIGGGIWTNSACIYQHLSSLFSSFLFDLFTLNSSSSTYQV